MKLGIVVNDVDTEVAAAATTVIAHAAVTMKHEVYMIGVGGFTYHSEGRIGAVARRVPAAGAKSTQALLDSIQGRDAKRTTILCDELDVLYLRYNPVEDEGAGVWQQDAGIEFGQVAARQGVLVLNDPDTLSFAVSKMYLEHFPESIRPRSIITRNVAEIEKFHAENKQRIVIKPVRGYGGKDVYLLSKDAANLNQIVESIGRSTYVIAQEYLPAAKDGDTRLFLVNGRPLQCDGKYAAVRRVNSGGDFRSNLSAGAKPHRAEVTDEILEIAEVLRPRLVADGLFEVGIDIVGNKVVEINAISSGGLNAAGKLEGVNFGPEIIRAIERKVRYRRLHGSALSNREIAGMD